MQRTRSTQLPHSDSESEYAPDWGLAHDVILHLELLHLTFADCAVLAFQELLLDLMPRADILPLQSYLYSG